MIQRKHAERGFVSAPTSVRYVFETATGDSIIVCEITGLSKTKDAFSWFFQHVRSDDYVIHQADGFEFEGHCIEAVVRYVIDKFAGAL